MAAGWSITLRGGAYDREVVQASRLDSVAIVWFCLNCKMIHGAWDSTDPRIDLARAEAYRRAEVDADARTAIYDVGDHRPAGGEELDARELTGAGAS